MLAKNQGIVESVVLVVVLDHRTRQLLAFFAAEPLRHRTRDDIAHDGFDRDDLQPLAQHLAIIEAAHEMRLDAVAFEQREEQLRHAVIDDALVLDRAFFLGIEGGRVVLEIGNDQIGVGGRIELLRLALVKHFELFGSRFHDYLRSLIAASGPILLAQVAGKLARNRFTHRRLRDYPQRLNLCTETGGASPVSAFGSIAAARGETLDQLARESEVAFAARA